MADELISRQAVKDAFHAYMARRFDKDICADAENCETCEGKCLWHEVVASVPAADAVEVVRCGECKHYEDHKRKIYENCMRDRRLFPMKPDDFCSYGERRAEDDKR